MRALYILYISRARIEYWIILCMTSPYDQLQDLPILIYDERISSMISLFKNYLNNAENVTSLVRISDSHINLTYLSLRWDIILM